MGFELALDDFTLQKQIHQRIPALFQFIDYIKMDFVSNTRGSTVHNRSIETAYIPTLSC